MSHFAGIRVRGFRLLTVTSGCGHSPVNWNSIEPPGQGFSLQRDNSGQGNSMGSRVVITTSHRTLQFLKRLHSVTLLSPHTCDVATALILLMKKVRLQGSNHKDMDLLRWSLDAQDQHIYCLIYELEYSGYYQWAHSLPWSESHLMNNSLGNESSIKKRGTDPILLCHFDYPKLPTSLTDNAHSPILAGQLGGWDLQEISDHV